MGGPCQHPESDLPFLRDPSQNLKEKGVVSASQALLCILLPDSMVLKDGGHVRYGLIIVRLWVPGHRLGRKVTQVRIHLPGPCVLTGDKTNP